MAPTKTRLFYYRTIGTNLDRKEKLVLKFNLGL